MHTKLGVQACTIVTSFLENYGEKLAAQSEGPKDDQIEVNAGKEVMVVFN